MIRQTLIGIALMFSGTAAAQTVNIYLPYHLTWLRCHYGQQHFEDMYAASLVEKGDLIVERSGEPPQVSFILHFGNLHNPYYCNRLEWSTRADLRTTGSLP